MSEKVGKDIVNFIGEFIEYDAKNNSNYLRPYMKIRVMLDVTKPLKRMKKIRMLGGESSIIKFKYERLGNFCYFCGMLGHIEDYCEKRYSLSSDDGIRIWGLELRVEKQRNNGGSANKLRDEGVTITTPTSVTVSKSNGHNAESGAANIPNSSTLMSLLRNPNLIRNSSAVNAAAANSIPHTHDDQLMEENNEAVITNKTKWSREIITDEGRIESSSTIVESNIHSATATSGTNHPSSTVAPIRVPVQASQTNQFLSAEPGIRACQEQ